MIDVNLFIVAHGEILHHSDFSTIIYVSASVGLYNFDVCYFTLFFTCVCVCSDISNTHSSANAIS